MQTTRRHLLVAAIAALWPAGAAGDWRSQMFPPDWVPLDERIVDGVNRFYDEGGTRDLWGNPVSEGHPDYHPYRFLHDFSHAGYRGGERPIPPEDPEWRPAVVLDVTRPPYGCVPDGSPENDCTRAIQRAIDDAEAAGGGVVHLPEGEYRISSDNAQHFLRIDRGGVVLRGDGPGKTRLLVDPFRGGVVEMYRKAVIAVKGGSLWHDDTRRAVFRTPIVEDLPFPTRTIPVANVVVFQIVGPGAEIAIQGRRTASFLAEHDMEGTWDEGRPAYLFRRTIMKVDPARSAVIVDIPTRYRIRLGDEPEVILVPPGIREVGLEGFSIGMIRHPDEWYFEGAVDAARDSGEPPIVRDLWQTRAIQLTNVKDCWIHGVESYRPAANAGRHAENRLTGKRFGDYEVEVLNEAIFLECARNVTVKDVRFRNAQVDTGSANGYAVRVSGSDNLLENVSIERMKKGFAVMDSWASGNVIKDCATKDPLSASDVFHWELSTANLVDNHTLDGAWWSAVIQGVDEVAQGHSSSQTVFWNIRGLRAPDTGIKTALDRDNDRNGRPDPQEAHGDLPDVALVISNQFGWGYVIGTHGAFSEVLTPRFQRQVRGDWSRPHVFPEDYSEGIGYPPRIVGSLEPRSLYEAQLARRLRRIDVRRNLPPTAVIFDLSPRVASLGQPVSFFGRGMDPDGSVLHHHWHSSINGYLSGDPYFRSATLFPGIHTISFSVADDEGRWSLADETIIEVRAPAPQPIVIDDGDPGTVAAGIWRASAGPGPWGTSSLYSTELGATYTFRTDRLERATYLVSLRWTTLPGRRSSVPVWIEHADGVSRVTVDQLKDGTAWVPVGSWSFDGTAAVRIISLGRGTTCADAVRFAKAGFRAAARGPRPEPSRTE